DGMGGARAGEIASGEAIRPFEDFTPAAAPEAELAALIRAANGRIHEMAADDEERSGMGTTVTAAAVSGDSVGIAHVGDSRAYRWRGGELEQLTEDHSLVGEMLRQGKISASEAETHPQRSIITRALGIEPEVEIDTSSVDWEPGDIFLLCSDGLTSMVPDQEIAAIIGGKESLEQAAAGLVDAANTHGGRDNITVILFSPGEDETTVLSSVPEEHHHTGSGGFRSRLGTRTGRALALALAIALLTGGAWLINRNIYYVGAHGGYVSIYRGVPVDMGPLSFSSAYSISTIRMDDLEPFERERIDRHDLRSLEGARQVVDNYSRQTDRRRQEQDSLGGGSATDTAPSATATGGGY
ncbi:MAG TPA: Stp1/IreP family PP2C-type Ser/Thr phosphatase, partial [Actinobacteria bacterium]|nr:Stp1/IreP family PP2C-type Ser/Thr phosphatase [Actinomycetota bacterium]